MSSTYVIPHESRHGFSTLVKSTPSKIKTLESVLSKIKKGVTPDNIVDRIVENKIYTTDKAHAVLKVLMEIAGVIESDTKRSIDEIADDLCLALIEAKDNDLKPKSDFKNNLVKLLSIELIGITRKSIDIRTEYDKVFIDTRIITDIRPSFERKVEDGFEVATVIHSLKIQYHHGEKTHNEVFFALDSNDLIQLKEQVIRAEKKEKSIKSNLKDKFHFMEPF